MTFLAFERIRVRRCSNRNRRNSSLMRPKRRQKFPLEMVKQRKFKATRGRTLKKPALDERSEISHEVSPDKQDAPLLVGGASLLGLGEDPGADSIDTVNRDEEETTALTRGSPFKDRGKRGEVPCFKELRNTRAMLRSIKAQLSEYKEWEGKMKVAVEEKAREVARRRKVNKELKFVNELLDQLHDDLMRKTFSG